MECIRFGLEWNQTAVGYWPARLCQRHVECHWFRNQRSLRGYGCLTCCCLLPGNPIRLNHTVENGSWFHSIDATVQVQKEMARNGINSSVLPREQWDTWDPMLISEGLFAAANIFRFFASNFNSKKWLLISDTCKWMSEDCLNESLM